jgi:hypothetical protein
MRIRNMQKRDQRVVETWKNDMEKANVQELLQNYIQNRGERLIDRLDIEGDDLLVE